MNRLALPLLGLLAACANEPQIGPPARTATSAAPSSAPSSSSPSSSCNKGHSVILVRHAEKASGTDKDPDLSDRGRARANVLAGLLGTAGVTRVVATEYHRTQQTVQPLADKAGLKLDIVPAKNMKELADSLRGAPDGSLTVVATHSNVIPELARQVGAPPLQGMTADAKAIPEDDYSRVVVLTFGCGVKAPAMVELRSDVPLCAVNLTDRSPALQTPPERGSLVSLRAAD